MKIGIKIVGGLLPLALLAVILVACKNDMDVLTPSDAVMNVWANPAAVTIDAANPSSPTEGHTTILAQLFDKNGYPLQNHVVYFSTDVGRMGSQGPPGAPPTPIDTDANGIARDTLVLTVSDAHTAKVTAQSSQITKQVSVSWHGDCSSVTPGSVTVAETQTGTLTMKCSGTTTTCTSDPPTPPDLCPTGETCCATGQTCDVSGTVVATLTATITPSADGTWAWTCGGSGVLGSSPTNVATCTYSAEGEFVATANFTNTGGCPAGHADHTVSVSAP